MLRAAACALALAVCAGAPQAAAGERPHRADGSVRDWRGEPGAIAGYAQVDGGELIYTDYLYDDYGPDLDGTGNAAVFRASGEVSGDYRYPADPGRYANNGADLRELRLALDESGLHGLVALQTMVSADAAAATVAIDRDGDPATGAGAWPDGAGLTTPGAELFVTVTGAGAHATTPDGTRRDVRASANLRANAFEFDLPARLLGSLSRDARVWVGAGLAEGEGYLPAPAGATALFDLGFQGSETYLDGSSWADQRQASALAAGQPAAFAGGLLTRALERGASRPLRLGPGFYNRIFRSDHAYGEGIDLRSAGITGGSSPQFFGRYQPYGLYVPRSYDRRRPAPLLLDLHALLRNHNMYASVSPNRLAELGEQRDSLVITPLGRGTEGWYLRAGLIDVLEAWDDAAAAYTIDCDRTSIAGYSMGGYGTYRLGLLMPDRFARAAVYVGPQVFGLWAPPGEPFVPEPEWRVASNTNLIVANGLNLPYELNYGDLDTLVPISGGLNQAATFASLGNPYRLYEHPTANHYSFVVADEWDHTRDWLGDARRVRNPQRVRYTRYPVMDLADAGLVFDGAYWVDGMVARTAAAQADFAAIDATTRARGSRLPELVDEGTTAFDGGEGGMPATVTGQHYAARRRGGRANAFTATFTNLARVTLDARRMALDPERPIRARLQGDGATLISLSGVWGEAPRARLDGEAIRVRSQGSAIKLRASLAEAGEHELVIHPAGGR